MQSKLCRKYPDLSLSGKKWQNVFEIKKEKYEADVAFSSFVTLRQELCPDGCPCPEYECPATSTSTTSATTSTATTGTTTATSPGDWVFVISTYKDAKAVLLNGFMASKQPDFTFGPGTQAYEACSITWKNQMYLFGGNTEVHQISRVENCQLSLVGQLSFRMRKGACTNLANEMVYICFPEVFRASSGKKCYKASQPLGVFESVVDSTYSHKSTRVGNDGGKAA